jgi:hypothetical protein
MRQPLTWKLGHDNVTIVCAADRHLPRSEWHQRLCLLLERMEGAEEFSVVDNGYKRYPGVLVTEGVKSSFSGQSFSVWSDVPGEIILVHPGMRASIAEQLCNKLSELWPAR